MLLEMSSLLYAIRLLVANTRGSCNALLLANG
jgi:hypothetical protein